MNRFITGTEVATSWRHAIEHKVKPILFTQPEEFKSLEVGPGLIAIIGGAPGQGKTALVMQMVFEMLRLNPTLRACVCNVELAPATLLDRELSWQAAVNAQMIRHRSYGQREAIAIAEAMDRIESVMGRIAFVQSPFNTASIAYTADEFGANLLVVDYIQRITVIGEHGDRRGGIDSAMNELRLFANDGGMGVVILSAISRSKNSSGIPGYNPSGISLASFKESSELEFGVDSAWILIGGEGSDDATLKCFKNRWGEVSDINLTFERHFQRFGKRELFLSKEWTGGGDDEF